MFTGYKDGLSLLYRNEKVLTNAEAAKLLSAVDAVKKGGVAMPIKPGGSPEV